MRRADEVGGGPAPPGAPSLPHATGFARELTPTWLTTAAVLAGQRPPDLGGPARFVHLGCGTGETVAVVAACHPSAEVLAWDPRPEHQEATRHLAQAAGLANLVVHEHRDPPELAGVRADLVVVQDVLARVDDATRARIGAAVAAGLRPGGLLCVTVPTLAAWAEIAPVQSLALRLASTHPTRGAEAVAAVLATLARLRATGAAFLTKRPVVTAWLDHLATLDPAEVEAAYLRAPLRPMSPAQVAGAVAGSGAELIGSARLTDDLDIGVPAALAQAVQGAPTRVLQETYRDLATRRPHRADLFRLGSAPLGAAEQAALLGRLRIASLVGPEEAPAVALAPEVWRQVTSAGATAADLHADPAVARRILRVLIDAGQVHPVVARGPGRRAQEACDALDAVLAAGPGGRRTEVRAVALLGSAVPDGRAAALRGVPAARGVG